MTQPPSLPPLVQAEVVLRLSAAAQATLPHVSTALSDFLDVSTHFTLPAAASSGSTLLLTRVAARLTSDTQLSPALLSHWFAGAMQAAIQQNDLTMVEKVHELHPTPLVVNSLKLAMQHGTLELIQWVVNNRHDRQCCAAGVENLCLCCLLRALPALGKQDTVRVVLWLLDEGFPLIPEQRGYELPPLHAVMLWSADFVRWYDERGLLTGEMASRQLKRVIFSDNIDPLDALEVTQYLVANGYTLNQDKLIPALTRASYQREKEVVVDFIWSSPLCDGIRSHAKYAATRPGGAKVLQWSREFLDQREHIGRQIPYYAVFYLHFDSIVWLCEARGIQPPRTPIQEPTTEQDLLLYFEWMKARGFDAWTPEEMDRAALHGNLEAVQWLHVNSPAGCTVQAMDSAAYNGHLPVLEWLHHNRTEGCTSAASKFAVTNGHFDVVKWLFENQSNPNTTETMASAVAHGRVDVLQWLHDTQTDGCLSCAADAAVNFAVGEAVALDGLRWLLEHGAATTACLEPHFTPTDRWAWLGNNAAAEGDLELLQFLGDHFPPPDARRDPFVRPVLASAPAIVGHLPIVEWLHENVNEVVDCDELRQYAAAFEHTHVTAWLDSVAA